MQDAEWHPFKRALRWSGDGSCRNPRERKAKTHFGSNGEVVVCCYMLLLAPRKWPGICGRATGVENGQCVAQQRERGRKALRQWPRRCGRSELFLCEGVGFLACKPTQQEVPLMTEEGRCHLQKC